MSVEVEDMKAGQLNLTTLGNQLFRVPLIATQLGHLSPRKTLLYMHSTTLEGEFVREFLYVMDPDAPEQLDAFCEKWFGGQEGVRLLLKRIHDPSYVSNGDADDA